MKKLLFVTDHYPFGNTETFIENENGYLSEAFDRVYIYATEAYDTEAKRPVPENVTAFAANPKPVSKKDYLTCFFEPLVIKEIAKNCFGENFVQKVSACCFFACSVDNSSKNISDFLRSCDIKSNDDITVYSYWLSTVGMCTIKIDDALKKAGVQTKIVSRCHRFDIYKDFSYTNYLPFQKYMLSRFNGVFPCSKDGENYLRKLYPRFASKIDVAYLGVKDVFNGNLPKKEDSFNIVSCSNVIPVKRVNLIIESLAEITEKKITWTHFGDGEDFERIKKLAGSSLPENIKYDFKGRVPNSEIYDYYNKNNVNLFINVSESEGLPVSIMEAISFGIPVIATDVGGTSEIVTDGKNGFLLKKDFELKELADFILQFFEMNEKEYGAFCENARNTFLQRFEAENNYKDFCYNKL